MQILGEHMPSQPEPPRPTFMAEPDITCCRTSLQLVWVSCPGCAPYSPLASSCLLALGELEKASKLCQHQLSKHATVSRLLRRAQCCRSCMGRGSQTQHDASCQHSSPLGCSTQPSSPNSSPFPNTKIFHTLSVY